MGNHATEAMGETGLFSLAQVCNRPLSLPFLSNLISNLFFILAGGADDEGLGGPLHGPRKVG